MYAAYDKGIVLRSFDGGDNWLDTTAPVDYWKSVACDSTAQYVVTAADLSGEMW